MTALSLFDDGPPPPCPVQFNIAAYVTAAAGQTPEKLALIVTGEGGEAVERWTHGEIARAIRATAAGLRDAGLRPGDRVALRLGNVSDFPLVFFGAIAAGGIAAPTAAALTPREFGRLVDDMAPRFVVASPDLELPALPGGVTVLGREELARFGRAQAGEVATTLADDPAYLVYTSGTGGSPKGVLHAQRSAWARRMMWDGWYGLGPSDRVLHAGAFNWTYTLGAGLTDPWAAGATAIVHAGASDPALWPRLIERHGATIFAAVPGVYRQMLRAADGLERLSTLRHGLTAGEHMPDALAESWRARTGCPVFEALGMSEVSTYISASPNVPPRPGTSGRPQPGRRVAILLEHGADPAPCGMPGLLAVSRRDPGLMLGYWNRTEDTEAAFRGEWFLTGDRASMDADGYVTWLGRADEVMTALGYRVAPVEVEQALAHHPAIAEVAVAELPVRPDLALIAAFVVPRGDWPGEETLIAHAEASLAAYKRPRLWIPVERIPRTANGKVLRRELVERHRRDR